MKVLVVYKCRSGYTRKYANWISEELQSDILELSKVNKQIINNYDIILYGGCLFANNILGFNRFSKFYDNIKPKTVIVFTVGIIPLLKNTTTKILTSNFTKEQIKHIKFCYLSGGFDYRHLSFYDKIKIKLLKRKIKIKKKNKMGLTAEEVLIMSFLEKPADFTKKENIYKIINYISVLQEDTDIKDEN